MIRLGFRFPGLIVVLLLLISVYSACQPQSPAAEDETAQPTEGETEPAPQVEEEPTTAPEAGESAAARPFVFATELEPVSLDPHASDLYYDWYVQGAAYETLLTTTRGEGGQLEVQPHLATEWEISPDATVYTLSLQEDVTFQDGTAFDAEAVKWNLERIIALGQAPSVWTDPIDTIEVLDAQTIRITLKSPFAPFLLNLSWPLMVSPTAAEENAQGDDLGGTWLFDHMVGTGPYLLEEWVHGEQASFVRNPDYWQGWEGAHLDAIVIQFVPDATTRKLMVERGEADLATRIDLADVEALRNAADLEVLEVFELEGLVTMPMKMRGALQDVRVRRAIALAFDYDGWANTITRGAGFLARGPFSPNWIFFDDSYQPYQQDLESARELMAEAGYPDGLPEPLEIMIVGPFQWWLADQAALLQSNLAEIGITLEIQNVPDASTAIPAYFNPDVNEGPDIYAWTTGPRHGDPHDYVDQYHTESIPPDGFNGMHYSNERFDGLVNQAVSTSDEDERAALYAELQSIMAEDQPAIWVGEVPLFIALHDNVLRIRSLM